MKRKNHVTSVLTRFLAVLLCAMVTAGLLPTAAASVQAETKPSEETLKSITAVTAPEQTEYTVAYGTAQDTIGLPVQLSVTFSGSTDAVLEDITWSGSYDGNAAGTYTLTSAFTDSGLVYASMPAVKVTVQEKETAVTITAAAAPEQSEYTVEYGTALEDAGLPAQLSVTFSDSAEAVSEDVTWAGSYDGSTAGTYTLTAAFTDSGLVYANMPEVSVTVKDEVQNKVSDNAAEKEAVTVTQIYSGSFAKGSISAEDRKERITQENPAEGETGFDKKSTYNLITDTTTTFGIHYKPFYAVIGSALEYGDLQLRIDLPKYGFQLTALPAVKDGISSVSGYTAAGVKTADVTKISYIMIDLDEEYIKTISTELFIEISVQKVSITGADGNLWLTQGYLSSSLKVTAVDKSGNEITVSDQSKPEFTWKLDVENYQDLNIEITGGNTKNTVAETAIMNTPASNAYTLVSSNSLTFDAYTFTMSAPQSDDSNTMPMNKWDSAKIYIPKTASETDIDNLSFKMVGYVVNIGKSPSGESIYIKGESDKITGPFKDDQGMYYLIEDPVPATFANHYRHYYNTTLQKDMTVTLMIQWNGNDKVEKNTAYTEYKAADPVFTFSIPNGTSTRTVKDFTGKDQGVTITTGSRTSADTWDIWAVGGGTNPMQLMKNSSGYYATRKIYADSTYTAQSWLNIRNGYKIANSNGVITETVPTHNGATVETYDFPKTIQPVGWSGNVWPDMTNASIEKMEYTTADGTAHTVSGDSIKIGSYYNPDTNSEVKFDTTAGRVTQVKVYWSSIGNSASVNGSETVSSNFTYKVTADAKGLIQIGYSAKAVSVETDNFIDSYAKEKVTNAVNDIDNTIANDFLWLEVVDKPCAPVQVSRTTDSGATYYGNNYAPDQETVYEDGTYLNNFTLYFVNSEENKYIKTAVNPVITLNMTTSNLTGLDSVSDKMGLLTGKFTAGEALAGWTITYTVKNNQTDAESDPRTYQVPDVIDDANKNIDLKIDRTQEHLASLKLSYAGTFDMSQYKAVSENVNEPSHGYYTGSGFPLFTNIEYEMRRTNWKGEEITLTDSTIHTSSDNLTDDYAVSYVALKGIYTNESCTCLPENSAYTKPHLHLSENGGQEIGDGRGATGASQCGLFYRIYKYTNADNTVYANLSNGTVLDTAQGGTITQVIDFNSKAYSSHILYHKDENGKSDLSRPYMPWGIDGALYVALTDDEYYPDLEKCTFYGYDNASGKVKIELVKMSDGRRFIKMAATDQMTQWDLIRNGSVGYGRMSVSMNGWIDGKNTHDTTAKIVLNTYATTSPTSEENNVHHYPLGKVYYDLHELETKLDASKDEEYVQCVLAGNTLDQLDTAAAEALGTTDEKKLFAVDLSARESVVTLQASIGGSVYPGVGQDDYNDGTVYETENSMPTLEFYPEEKNNLTAQYVITTSNEDEIKDYTLTIKIPKKGDTVSYGSTELTNQYSMYLTGKPNITSQYKPDAVWSFSINGTDYVTEEDTKDWTEEDWNKVTSIKLVIKEITNSSQVVVGIPLSADQKTVTDQDFNAYLDGSYEYSGQTGKKVSGTSLPCKYAQKSYVIDDSDSTAGNAKGGVWWDIDEDGTMDESEKNAAGITLKLYSPDHDITINTDTVIKANTLIYTAVTDANGKYTLLSYLSDAGQYIRITMPDQTTVLTSLSDNADITAAGDSNFDRTSLETKKLDELTSAKDLTGIGAGLVHLPTLTASDVKMHVIDAQSEGGKCNPVYTSENPGYKPAIVYETRTDAPAAVDANGKVTPNGTGTVKAKISASNKVGDTVSAEYTITVYSNVKYDANNGTGTVPEDQNEYYPSDSEATDKVTVLSGETLSRLHYTFAGWAETADAETAKYQPGNEFQTGSVKTDTTLYAVWLLNSKVTLTANGGSYTYDGKEKTAGGFTADVEGISFTGIEVPEVKRTNAGTEDVKFKETPETAVGSDRKTYDVTYVDAQLVIDKAVLTVTADDKTKKAGSANPELTYTITGFAGTDTEASVTDGKKPVLNTEATAGSAAGVYPITVDVTEMSADNYSFKGVAGKLTVTAVDNPTPTNSPHITCEDIDPNSHWDETTKTCVTPTPAPIPTVKPGVNPVPSSSPTPDASVTVSPSASSQSGVKVTAGPSADAEQPAYGNSGKSWALINLILTALTLILGIIALVSKTSKNEDEDEDENQETVKAVTNEDEEDDEPDYKRKKWLRVLLAIVAIAEILVFIFTEDISQPMRLVDKWTWVMALITLVGFISFIFAERWIKNDDEDEDTDSTANQQ